MKILVIHPTADKKGHFGLYVTNLCQEMAKLGHRVVLFTNKLTPEKFIKNPPKFKIIEYKSGLYVFDKFEKLKQEKPWLYTLGYLRNSWIILNAGLRYAKNDHFDVIQIMDTEYAIASLSLLMAKNLPPAVLLINAPNFSFSKYPGSFLIKTYKIVQREILRLALRKKIKGIITLGHFHRKELIKQLSLKKNFPIAIIYDGVNLPKKLSKTAARKKLNINSGLTVFLFFGMIRKDKGIKCLFDACQKIRQKKFKLIVAGSPFDYTKEQIKKSVSQARLQNQAILNLDYLEEEELGYYFSAADAIIFPYTTLYTGGSGPLVKEAAAYGLPAIASNVSEMGYLVKTFKLGLVFEPENSLDLAKKMEHFIHLDKKTKTFFSKNIKNFAKTWKEAAQNYLSFYEKIKKLNH